MTESGGFGRKQVPDMDETKEHILAAGRELMLAADGALRFCKSYAESFSSPQSRSQLVSFFSKAIAVADELAKGLITASGKEAAKKAAGPLFDALGREMAHEAHEERAGRTRAKPKSKEADRRTTRPARRKKVARKHKRKSVGKR
jgi:hypothetical protein